MLSPKSCAILLAMPPHRVMTVGKKLLYSKLLLAALRPRMPPKKWLSFWKVSLPGIPARPEMPGCDCRYAAMLVVPHFCRASNQHSLRPCPFNGQPVHSDCGQRLLYSVLAELFWQNRVTLSEKS